MPADLILHGGCIFSGLAEGFVEALAIQGDRVVACGPAGVVEAHRTAATRLVDLAGRAAIPAFNDAHMHLLTLGRGMVEVRLRPEDGVSRLEDVLARVRAAATGKAPGEWIVGRGYNQADFADEARHPSIEELDQAAPDHPVYLKRTCGHLAVANSAAFRAAGIDDATPDPEGGLLERRDGRLTGLLAERAMLLMTAVLPKASRAELVEAIERGGRHMLSQGFTSVMDAAVGQTGFGEVEAYEEAAATGRLPLRAWLCLYGDPGGVAEVAHARGLTFGREVGLLRYGAMKIFADGSAGSLTAAMSEPYRVGPSGNTGILCFRDEDIWARLKAYHEQGYQLAIHAIGDAAIEQVLRGIEGADTPEHPIAGRRHRIEHCGFLSDGQMARMSRAGIYAVPQSIFIYEFGDLYGRVLGEVRAQACYPLRKWIEAGMVPSASSDAPVCTTDPLKNLYAMVTRRTKAGASIGGDQTMSVAEAIHAYTYASAFTQFAEHERGRLVPGQLADVAILSHDIFALDPARLEHEVGCDMTILGGRIVHEAPRA